MIRRSARWLLGSGTIIASLGGSIPASASGAPPSDSSEGQPNDPDGTSSPAGETDDDAGFGFAPLGGATYSGETSVRFGAAAMFFFKPPGRENRRESRVMLATAYSLKNQFTVVADASLYLQEDRLRLTPRLLFSIFPNSFFGLGNNTRLESEERYTPHIQEGIVSAQHAILPGLYLGPAVSIEHQEIVKTESDGMLATSDIPGGDGGTVVGVGIDIVYDHRDSTLYPHQGVLLQLRSLVADPAWGSDFRRSWTRVDLRGYIPMPFEDHIFALRGLGDFGTGTHPFWDMPQLGGQELLRGQFEGRYRDRQAVAIQTEYRLPIYWRFGMVGFLEVGEVARKVSDLALDGLRYSAGGGLRFNVSNKAPMNIRIDAGGGRDDWDIYINVGEAF